jgi:thioredoxin reductase (NADPH)
LLRTCRRLFLESRQFWNLANSEKPHARVVLDDKGFVKTSSALVPAEVRAPNDGRLPLETSAPGVFAIGDVRAGSVKRVGSAIGEGAAVVA